MTPPRVPGEMPGLEPLVEEGLGVAVMVAVAIVTVVALPESYSSTEPLTKAASC